MRKARFAEESTMIIARGTPGFSGATSNLVNEARACSRARKSGRGDG